MPESRDRRAAGAVAEWFCANARPLPWRTEPRDPYRSLVSEFMLQQTQVSRVLEKYEPFLDRFPTLAVLADADEDDVLASWSGLGYYRRARMLHRAAKDIAERFDGRVPSGVSELRSIPGIGAYTAGAIASLVFGEREALVDGNVTRVLMRFDGREGTQEAATKWAWERARDLVDAAPDAESVAPMNEGLMELGATVCIPKSPRCVDCPLHGDCVAFREGRADEIPPAKSLAKKKTVWCAAVIVRDGRRRLVVEQRPKNGLWASMWQAPTIESTDGAVPAGAISTVLGLPPPELLGAFTHITTHRTVEFAVYDVGSVSGAETRRLGRGRRWVTPDNLSALALSNAQKRVLEYAERAAPVS